MNRMKSRYSKVKAKRVEPGTSSAPRLASPTPVNPRIVILKAADRITAPVEGIPDHITTRWICFGTGAIGVSLGVELLITFFFRPSPNDPGFGADVLLVLLALGMIATSALLIREGMRTGAWFTVGPSGIHYGEGQRDDKKNMGTRIEWKEIVSNPKTSCDIAIRYQGTYSKLKVPRITFWHRSPAGDLVERTMPLWLTENMLRCVRFRNAQEVRVGLLQGLAERPGLRFHPDVFVDAGIDPQTWKPMRRPVTVDWSILMTALAIWIAFAFIIIHATPLAALFASFVMIFGMAVFASITFRRAAYPDFTGIICFCPEQELDTGVTGGPSRPA